MRFVRRAHLYCGLAMLPWVLLYAVSGLLFNHPGLGGDGTVTRFSMDALSPSVTEAVPEPEVAALAVVEALRGAAPGATVELATEPSPTYQRSLVARGQQGEHEVSLSLDPTRGSGSLRVAEPELRAVPGSLAAVESLEVAGLELAAFEAMAAATAAERLPTPPAELTVTSTPRVRLGARIDGEPWIVTYDPKAGTVEYARADRAEVSLERLLARLHMTHVYPGRFGVRWIHALVVDLTVACLVLWCVSGLMMGWQLRRQRRVGMVVLLSGLAASGSLLARVVPGLLG